MKFIDVSSHNGKIDFNAVRNSGIEAVIIKSTEGTTYQDPMYLNNYNGAKNAGLKIGFYHFYNFASSPETNAENFWNHIKSLNFDIKPVLDIETSNGNVEECCNRFLRRFSEISGGTPMLVYSYRSFIEQYFSDAFCNDKYWWIAEYGSRLNTPAKCGTPTAWQYTEKGNVPGVNGNCDMNVLYQSENFFLNGFTPSANNSNNTRQEVTGKIAELQQILGVTVDNIWGPITDQALLNAHFAANSGTGYHNSDLTTWIQLRLGIEADGIFGSKTESDVKRWQSSHGLTVDGIAGYNTIKSLALA